MPGKMKQKWPDNSPAKHLLGYMLYLEQPFNPDHFFDFGQRTRS